MSTCLNLTRHPATSEQIEAGVYDPTDQARETIITLLTIEELPTVRELRRRATELAAIAVRSGANRAMIGGMGALMWYLRAALWDAGVEACEAFTRRNVVDHGDGTKTVQFLHVGFIVHRETVEVSGVHLEIEKVDHGVEVRRAGEVLCRSYDPIEIGDALLAQAGCTTHTAGYGYNSLSVWVKGEDGETLHSSSYGD